MSHLEKYLIIKQYYGLSAINIVNTSKTFRERQMKIAQIKENFNILENDNFPRLKSIIKTLNKPTEKRQEKELQEIVPLLQKLDFFEVRNKLNAIELEQVAANIKYTYKEPGETIFKAGDKADNFYIVMKGRVMLQIPAPNNTDFGMPVAKKVVEVKPDTTIEDKQEERRRMMEVKLTPEQLAELPVIEQKKYRTR